MEEAAKEVPGLAIEEDPMIDKDTDRQGMMRQTEKGKGLHVPGLQN